MSLSKNVKSIFLNLSGNRQKKDFFAYILCFFVASTFWFLKQLNNNFTTTLSYPIETFYDAQTYTISKNLPDFIKVNITGFGWKILDKMYGFHKEPIVIRDEEIFIKNYLPTANILPVINQSFGEIKIHSVSPDTLFYTFDRKIVRKVPVLISTDLQFRSRFDFTEEPLVNPDSVMVEGAASLVNLIKSISTKPLVAKDVYQDFSRDIELDFTNALGVKINLTMVNVSFLIDEYVEEKKQLRITKINFPEQFSTDSILPQFCTVIYKTPRNKSQFIADDSFLITMDYRFIDPKLNTIALKAEKIHKGVRDFSILNPIFVNVKDRYHR